MSITLVAILITFIGANLAFGFSSFFAPKRSV